MRDRVWLGLVVGMAACEEPHVPEIPGVVDALPDAAARDVTVPDAAAPPDALPDAGAADGAPADAGARDLGGPADAAVPPLGGAHLVINEIDYDQVGLDGTEFVEILNPTPDPVPLEGLRLEYVDGLSGEVYSALALSEAGPALAPGALLVLANPDVLAILPMELPKVSAAVRIQNGPDGLRLVDGEGGTIDRMSYGGAVADVTEGDPPAAADGEDDPDRSLGRCGGADTDDNAADFSAMPPTPGRPNACDAAGGG